MGPRVCAVLGCGGQVRAVAGGGPQVRTNSSVQACSQGQAVGRCRTRRRAEDATRAGTWINVRRIVAVFALPRLDPAPVAAAMTAAARVRLNAITASTSQALFAVKTPEGM